MKIILDKEESENLFLDAMCNFLGGMRGYGLELEYNDADYEAAKKVLKDKNPNETICYEPVLMEMLKMGKSLTFNDIEGEGDQTSTITLADVHKRVKKTPLRHLVAAINGDADTADAILQTVFFKEIIFG